MTFALTQYGGSTGGSAGDACLIQLGDKRLVVDFGVETQADWLKSDAGNLKKGTYDAVVTHFHNDHRGKPIQRKNAAKLWVNKTSTMDEHATTLEYDNCRIANNDDEIWNPTEGNLAATVWFIAGPGTAYHAQGENAHSAGVYGEVVLATNSSEDVVFRWLLLGDMVSGAWDNVNAVLPEDVKLNYVKLPHHGSPSNHMPELFSNYVDTHTQLASSGYNFLDGEWNNIVLDNDKITREQMWVLTHHPEGAPGQVWQPRQKKWLNFTITIEGKRTINFGQPDKRY
jgi:hypothetical protein